MTNVRMNFSESSSASGKSPWRDSCDRTDYNKRHFRTFRGQYENVEGTVILGKM